MSLQAEEQGISTLRRIQSRQVITQTAPAAGIWHVILRFDDDHTERILIDSEKAIIVGRADQLSPFVPDLDLNVYNGEMYGVSRRHAELTITDNALCITDMDSTNGTKVNGRMLKPGRATPVTENDDIEFSRLRVRVDFIQTS